MFSSILSSEWKNLKIKRNITIFIILTAEKRYFDKFGVWKSGEIAPEEIRKVIKKGEEQEFQEMRNMEIKRLEGILSRIKTYQNISAIFPTTFYLSLNKELSSKGFHGFIDFYRYSFKMKHDFIKFYAERKFFRSLPKSGVESFIKGDENLFYGRSSLTSTVPLGLLISFLYMASMLFYLYRTPLPTAEKPEKKLDLPIPKEEGIQLVVCRDEGVKADLFTSYRSMDDTLCIGKENISFSLNGLSAKDVLHSFCLLSRIDSSGEQKSAGYLRIFNMFDLKVSELGSEDILKIFVVVKVALEKKRVLVLDDFFEMKSRKFKKDFIHFLTHLYAEGREIHYLSCDFPIPIITDEEPPMNDITGQLDLCDCMPLDFSRSALA